MKQINDYRASTRPSSNTTVEYPCSYLTLHAATSLLAALAFGLILYTALQFQVPSFYLVLESIFAVVSIGAIAILLLQNKHTLARPAIVLSYLIVALSALYASTLASPHVAILIVLTFIISCVLLNHHGAIVATVTTIASAFGVHFSSSVKPTRLTLIDALLYGGMLLVPAAILVLYRYENRRSKHGTRLNHQGNFSESHAQDLYHFALFGQLAAATAHDLSNRLCLLTLDLDTIDSANAQKILPNIKDNIHYINKLVQTTKCHFSTRSTALQFDAIVIIQQVVNETQKKCVKKNITLSVRYPPQEGSFYLEGPAIALQHVLTILLNNALEACRAASPPDWSPHIFVSVATDRAFLVITVFDNGPGISKHLKTDLFKPISSHKPSGMGIGLYIAHELTREHFGGTLQTVSHKTGACFTIRIPVAKAPRAVEQGTSLIHQHIRQLSHAYTEPD